MKKGIIAVFILLIAFCGCKKKEDQSQSIDISIAPTDNKLVGLNATIHLVATARDENFKTLDIPASSFEWFSNDTLVASVDQSGLVKPKGPGLTYIHAKYNEAEGIVKVNVCVCYKELYKYNEKHAITGITREPIECDDYLNKVYDDGSMDMQTAIDSGAVELDPVSNLVTWLKKKVCE
jgi:hypothetical protein